MENLLKIAGQFMATGNIMAVAEFGSGNINRTYLVTPDAIEAPRFILQRINTHVFHDPQAIMRNMRLVSDHICAGLPRFPLAAGRRWQMPHILPARDGQDLWRDAQGSCWRAISFIEGAQSFDTIQDVNHARETGYALGLFHALVSDLPAQQLADTLPGFHVAPLYLQQYDEVCGRQQPAAGAEAEYCTDFVAARRDLVNVLENGRAQGRLAVRLMHGDPKVNNIMIDTDTGMAVSIIDLDTVKPGLVQYDIGDCLRSGCNVLGEETTRWEDVHFDAGLCRAILQGYLAMAGRFFTDHDYESLYDAVRLLAFELGVRFFADYLSGNVYFKIKDPEHNLRRALVQFRLTESIEAQELTLRAIIRELR